MVTYPYSEKRGDLVAEPNPDGSVLDVFFAPLVSGNGIPDKVKILSLSIESENSGELRIFPIRTNPNSAGYLERRYSKIKTLSLMVCPEGIDPFGIGDFELYGLLQDLPAGFGTNFNFGLGLPRQFDRLIKLIEDNTDCREIAFVHGSLDVRINEGDPTVLRFGLDRFEKIRAGLSRINDRGTRAIGRVSDAYVHNELASVFSLDFVDFNLGRLPDSRFVARSAANMHELSDQEQDQLVDVVVSKSAALAAKHPESFHRLHRDVELVSLEQLIESFEDALKKKWSEKDWQKFFKGNEFALQMVFGAPVVIVQDEASVGGTRLDGKGGKIADYLMRNTLSNNLALVEIKKPSTPLLAKKEYREGVYAPSKELDGAVTQVLDQAHKLPIALPAMTHFSRRTDLEAYSVSCVVIAGRSPSAAGCLPAREESDRHRSFELYRGNSRNVRIVTYDEVLEQLKALRDFLRPVEGVDEAAVRGDDPETPVVVSD